MWGAADLTSSWMEWAKCQVDLPEFPDWKLAAGLKVQSRGRAVGESAEEKGSALEDSRKDV